MHDPSLHYRSNAKPGEPGGIGNPVKVTLFVAKHCMSPFASRPWRLFWSESAESDNFVGTESATETFFFKTMRLAVLSGEQRFNITAVRHPGGGVFS